MKRYLIGVLAVLVVSAVAAGGAFSATSMPWQATVGHFKTTTAASKEISKLSAKGYSGFANEAEKSGQFSNGAKYEVSKSFATQKLAKADVSKLHKAGFNGAAVESEKNK
jgi:curli biogenesis system outer membrane secretion channel CsgG